MATTEWQEWQRRIVVGQSASPSASFEFHQPIYSCSPLLQVLYTIWSRMCGRWFQRPSARDGYIGRTIFHKSSSRRSRITEYGLLPGSPIRAITTVDVSWPQWTSHFVMNWSPSVTWRASFVVFGLPLAVTRPNTNRVRNLHTIKRMVSLLLYFYNIIKTWCLLQSASNRGSALRPYPLKMYIGN